MWRVMTAPGRWFRDVYRDAVWESEKLTADQKAIAETYSRHARDENGDKSATAAITWVTYDRLTAKSGVNRQGIKDALEVLEHRGWLVVIKRVHRRPTVYRLAVPDEAEQPARSSSVGTTVVPLSDYGSSTGSSDVGTTVVPDLDLVVPAAEPRWNDVGTPPLKELPSSQSPSGNPRSAEVRRIVAATGATDDEAEAVIQKIKNENKIRKPFGVYLHAIPDEHLVDILDAVRQCHREAEAQRAATDAEHRRRTAPRCKRHMLPTPCRPCADEAPERNANAAITGPTGPPRRCPHCKQWGSTATPPPNPCSQCNPLPVAGEAS